MSDNEDNSNDTERSDIAEAVQRLHAACVDAASKRERLPQPLFWSLFATQLREIRELKTLRRTLSEFFDNSGE